ncbi:GntR family transcriptional regulator [Gordonia rhizosphera]|uniref:Putative GntR family transcriptional regulator n=1 Tax=Gordonia rhizosphera NBRC 16068 TaxID=1108045 RepID=K6WQQ0_9ACTN|nr:GntR family transcriptional regulator [Gordonia rhizosphera]GAB88849.1 putative GntR family transcriptional regulator [Gordonia rhizosphera NBRC 16068]
MTASADPLRPFDQRSAAVARTEHALFGRLDNEDASVAVARRLRTAIGLGVLGAGEKLPKEADLARQMGVTPFSLREALATLRAEGLIITRAGGRGGSFVEAAGDSGAMARETLSELTATELRDLGDWRAGLTTYAAWLAAQRGSTASAERLAALADELREVTAADQGRRVLGRFHVELASAAQSMRLTRADLSAHEEFDWLVQVLLDDSQQREVLADAMADVAEAVRAADADSAWNTAQNLVSHEITELTRHRLQLIADGIGSEPGPHADLVTELHRIATVAVDLLEAMAGEISDEVSEPPVLESLTAVVARAVLPRLGRVEELVYGIGFMAAIELLDGAPYWIEWWQRAADGTFDRDYSHQLDPGRDDFYDYGSQEYFTSPQATARPHAMGPYIDHGGVDDYLVTVTAPVTRAGEFLGIICADVRVAGLEIALSPWLAREAGECLVLNADSRVLLSNSMRYNVGDLVPAEPGLEVTDVGAFGWTVARQ